MQPKEENGWSVSFSGNLTDTSIPKQILIDMPAMNNSEKLLQLKNGIRGIYEFSRGSDDQEEDFLDLITEAISAAVALGANDLKLEPSLALLRVDFRVAA